MHRHIPTPTGIVPVGKELAHELLEREPALLEDASLSILQENDILGGQRGGGADGDAFLAGGDLFNLPVSWLTKTLSE